jgi:hypothetical protein
MNGKVVPYNALKHSPKSYSVPKDSRETYGKYYYYQFIIIIIGVKNINNLTVYIPNYPTASPGNYHQPLVLDFKLIYDS